jgi:hypothetical protein
LGATPLRQYGRSSGGKATEQSIPGQGSTRFRVARWQNWPMRQTGHFSRIFGSVCSDVAVHHCRLCSPPASRSSKVNARPAVLFIRRDLRGRSALLPQDLDVQSVPRKKLRILIRNHAMRGVGSVSENHNLNAVAHVALQGELSL